MYNPKTNFVFWNLYSKLHNPKYKFIFQIVESKIDILEKI